MTELIKFDFGELAEVDAGKLEEAFSQKKGFNPLIEKIAKKVDSELALLPKDLSKNVNRAKYKSLAYEVSKIRSAMKKSADFLVKSVDDAMKEYTNKKALIRENDDEIADRLAAIRDKAKALAVEFEGKMKEKEEKLYSEIKGIADTGNMIGQSIELIPALGTLKAMPPKKEHFGKLFEAARSEWTTAIDKLKKSIELAELKEADEKRKAEEEKARIQKEADEKAAAALRQKEIDAEAEKQRAKEVKERMIKQRIEEIKNFAAEIIESNSDGLKYRLELLHKTSLNVDVFGEFLPEAREAYAQAQSTLNTQLEITVKREKEEQEEQERQAKIQREKEAAEALRRQKEQEENEAAERKANDEHRKRINADIKVDLIAAGFDKEVAADLVFALNNGKVRHVKIEY